MTNRLEHHTHTRRCWWDLDRGGWRCASDHGTDATRTLTPSRPGRSS